MDALTVALNLNMLAGNLQREVRQTLSMLARAEREAWTQAEIDALNGVLRAIVALDRASAEAGWAASKDGQGGEIGAITREFFAMKDAGATGDKVK